MEMEKGVRLNLNTKVHPPVFEMVPYLYTVSKAHNFIGTNIKFKTNNLPVDEKGFYTECP